MIVNPTEGLMPPPPSPFRRPSDAKGFSDSQAVEPTGRGGSTGLARGGEGRGRVEVGGRDDEGAVGLSRSEAEEVDDAEPV